MKLFIFATGIIFCKRLQLNWFTNNVPITESKYTNWFLNNGNIGLNTASQSNKWSTLEKHSTTSVQG